MQFNNLMGFIKEEFNITLNLPLNSKILVKKLKKENTSSDIKIIKITHKVEDNKENTENNENNTKEPDKLKDTDKVKKDKETSKEKSNKLIFDLEDIPVVDEDDTLNNQENPPEITKHIEDILEDQKLTNEISKVKNPPNEENNSNEIIIKADKQKEELSNKASDENKDNKENQEDKEYKESKDVNNYFKKQKDLKLNQDQKEKEEPKDFKKDEELNISSDKDIKETPEFENIELEGDEIIIITELLIQEILDNVENSISIILKDRLKENDDKIND